MFSAFVSKAACFSTICYQGFLVIWCRLFAAHARLPSFLSHLCRITRPGPRTLAGKEVDGAPGNADDVSRPGADRWRCRCWLGCSLIEGLLHLYVNSLNCLLYSRGVH